MPKHRKQRGRVNKIFGQHKDPILNEQVRQDKVLPVIDQLKSPEYNDRCAALNSILNLIEDGNVRHMLLRERLIKIVLASVIGDSSLEITSLGIGALSSIVRLEGHDSAVFVVREKIQNRLSQVSSNISSSVVHEYASLDAKKVTVINELSERVFRLVSAIVMHVDDVSELESSIALALLLIDKHTAGASVSPTCIEAAFEMLYYVSEGSEQSFNSLIEEERILKLKDVAITTDKSWSTRVYGLGLEFNLLVLSTDDPAIVSSAADQLSQFLIRVPKSEMVSVRVALELLAILAQSDEPDIISFLVDRTSSLILNDLLPAPDYRLDSVSLLNNLGWAQNALELPWNELANKTYEVTMANCFNQLEDLELLTSSFGLIGAALIQNESLVQSPGFQQLISRTLEHAESLYGQSDNGWISVVRAIVVLLTSKGLPAVRLNLIAETTRLILLLLESNVDVEAHIDALNALFELFGDNDAPYNEKEYKETGCNDKLKQLKPSLKRSLRSPPKSNPALRQQAIDALTNLENFIAYKQS